MFRNIKGGLLAGAVALCVCVAAGYAGGKGDNGAVNQVPREVRDTLVKAAEGAPIDAVQKEGDGDSAVYIADVTIEGKQYEIKVAADGKLISKKMEDSGGGQGNGNSGAAGGSDDGGKK